MARTFEILRRSEPRWVEHPPGDARIGDVVRVKDAGTVVSAILPVVPNDPQAYLVFTDGTTSVVNDTDDPLESVKVGVSVFHPDGDVTVISLDSP